MNPLRRSPHRPCGPAVGLCLLLSVMTWLLPAHAQTSILDEVLEQGVLRAGIRRDNPPHSFIDTQGHWVGFDVDIAAALAEELGVKLERVPVDELTRISFLQTGKIHVAVASMSHTLKRDRQVDFSQTYFWSSQTFLVKDTGIDTLADLVGKRVGMDRGSHAIGNWRDWQRRHGHQPRDDLIVEFSSKQAAVQAVRSGAIAGYAEDYTLLASFARQNPGLKILDGAIGMKQDGIGIRENDSKMRDAVNFALQRMQTSGRYDAIYNHWFGPESATPVPRLFSIEVWPNG